MKKFNVHHWDGKQWKYIATSQASNEQIAAKAVSKQFKLTGRFASYPHIDTYIGERTSNSAFTEIL